MVSDLGKLLYLTTLTVYCSPSGSQKVIYNRFEQMVVPSWLMKFKAPCGKLDVFHIYTYSTCDPFTLQSKREQRQKELPKSQKLEKTNSDTKTFFLLFLFWKYVAKLCFLCF